MRQKVNIEGIKLYAYHGCLEEEARIGGNYVIDVHFETDFSAAAENDDLSGTVDYCDVYEICKEEMAVRSKLIEQVGMRIFRSLKKKFPGTGIHLKLTKLLPPVNGEVENASIEISDDGL